MSNNCYLLPSTCVVCFIYTIKKRCLDVMVTATLTPIKGKTKYCIQRKEKKKREENKEKLDKEGI